MAGVVRREEFSLVPYDVIVVGAGPAGSVTAHDCARAGLRTLLLEKFSLPRDKPCGGAVMYRGLRILKDGVPKSLVEQRVHGLRFTLPKGDSAEFRSDKLLGITVFRSRFDEFLARRAATAGAEFLEQARVLGATSDRQGTTVRLSDGREFRSQFLIGADGANSVVAKSLALRPDRKDLTRVGLGMESDFHVGAEGVLEAMNGDPSILSIVPAENRVSYGWVFPKKEHLSVGIAGAAAHMFSLRPMFDAFCRKMEKEIGVELTAVKRRAWFLGADGVVNKNVMNRVILVGDAAGFVDPMMGEGIAYAMKSGVFAAEVILQALEEEKYGEGFLEQYQKLCVREFGANFRMAEWAGLRGTSFAEFVLTKASGHRLASEILAMLARGDIGYSAIPQTIVKSLPRELPDILRRIVQSRMAGPS
ncbi:MAG: NAD(P)/FAD-dependent oxidoreductase [Candidatus Thorarchaeota archaeon]